MILIEMRPCLKKSEEEEEGEREMRRGRGREASTIFSFFFFFLKIYSFIIYKSTVTVFRYTRGTDKGIRSLYRWL